MELTENIKFSSKTIENMQLLNPKLIHYDFSNIEEDEVDNDIVLTNFIELLSKLKKIEIWMWSWINEDFSLTFNDVIWKVAKSKFEWSYIRVKSLTIKCKSEELNTIK